MYQCTRPKTKLKIKHFMLHLDEDVEKYIQIEDSESKSFYDEIFKQGTFSLTLLFEDLSGKISSLGCTSIDFCIFNEIDKPKYRLTEG